MLVMARGGGWQLGRQCFSMTSIFLAYAWLSWVGQWVPTGHCLQAKGEEEGGEVFRLWNQTDPGSSLSSASSCLVLRPSSSDIFL